MNEDNLTNPKKATNTLAGRLYLIFLGICLILIGSLFTGMMWLSVQRAKNTRGWIPQEAEITESKKTTRQKPGHNLEFQWHLRYRYQIGGKTHQSLNRTLRENKWHKKEKQVDALIEQYPVGKKLTCYVNPALASQAILEHDSFGPGYSIWFPMLFVVGGGGMIIGVIRQWQSQKITLSDNNH